MQKEDIIVLVETNGVLQVLRKCGAYEKINNVNIAVLWDVHHPIVL